MFRLLVQLADESDPTDDVTALWPADRLLVELGRLEVTGSSPTGAADERRMVFDPTNLADGIALSADPILLARSAVYSLSYDRRHRGECATDMRKLSALRRPGLVAGVPIISVQDGIRLC